MKDYFWSKLFLVFIPKEKNKTLAEMTFEEYQEWRTQRARHSSAKKFAEWISKQ